MDATPLNDRRPTAEQSMEPVGEVPASTGGAVDIDRILGRIPIVLVFLEPPDDSDARQALEGMGRHLVDFGRDRVQLLAVARRSSAEVQRLDDQVPGNVRILADPDGSLAERFEGEYDEGRPTTVLIDVNGQLAASWNDDPSPDLAVDLLRRIDTWES